LNPDACKIGDSEHLLGICEEGYDGFLCGSCAE